MPWFWMLTSIKKADNFQIANLQPEGVAYKSVTYRKKRVYRKIKVASQILVIYLVIWNTEILLKTNVNNLLIKCENCEFNLL